MSARPQYFSLLPLVKAWRLWHYRIGTRSGPNTNFVKIWACDGEQTLTIRIQYFKFFLLYHTGMVKYCNCAWKKYFFFASLFENISNTAETILIKKIEQNHGVLVYKKVLMSEHRKIIFFEILIVLSKCLLVHTFQIFVYALDQKLVWISKQNFISSFGALRLRADYLWYRTHITL